MKKLLVLGLIAIASSLVYASELYWMVDEDVVSGYTTTSWDIAQLVKITGSTYEYGNNNNTVISFLTKEEIQNGAEGYVAEAAGYSGSYFVIELVQSSQLGKTGTGIYGVSSDVIAYQNLVYEGGMSSIPTASFGSGGIVVVPEPNTGLLVMLGMLALGLKRKQERC